MVVQLMVVQAHPVVVVVAMARMDLVVKVNRALRMHPQLDKVTTADFNRWDMPLAVVVAAVRVALVQMALLAAPAAPAVLVFNIP